MKSVDALRELVERDGLILEGEEFDKCLDAIEEEGMAIYAGAHGDGAAFAFELTKIAYKGDDERYQFCRRVEVAANDRDDVTLFGVDYTPLPVDADGVPIHVGDVMEADNGTTFEVEHISLYQWGWRCVGEGTDRSGVTCTAHAIPDGCRHHHAPTVEDVLADVADRAANLTGSYHDGGMNGDEYMESMRALVTEYAAKLMLKED